MARKTKRERKRVIVTDDCFLYAKSVNGCSDLALAAWTESGYQYVLKLSGLGPSKIVWMIEKLSERAAHLLKVERDEHLRLERRMQEAAKRVSDATKGGA